MRQIRKWLQPGLYVKRWLVMMLAGLTIVSIGVAYLLVVIFVAVDNQVPDDAPPVWFTILTLSFLPVWMRVFIPLSLGFIIFARGILKLNQSLLGPLIPSQSFDEWMNILHNHHFLRHGIRVVAMGGGTGLPSALRAMKTETSNITAVVTVADDGGSSGRLRREMGMQPPGDLRNNIAALARDEDLMTELLNYRFDDAGGLSGHTFGNLFLAALVKTQGGMDQAALAAGRVLAIQGQVLPCTLDDIDLIAEVEHRSTGKMRRIRGESSITQANGFIREIGIVPRTARVLPQVTQSIYHADLIILGPGSLYTSVIPNLLVQGVAEAIRVSKALVIYVCNIATQPGETENFNVADHVRAIEQHVGHDIIDVVIANNHYPRKNAGVNTIYVEPIPEDDPILTNYQVLYVDLTDNERPWRHSHDKLRKALLELTGQISPLNVDEMPKDKNRDYTLQSSLVDLEKTSLR